MPDPAPSVSSPSPPPSSSGLGCVLRLIWLLVGNLALVFTAVAIAHVPPGRLTWRDPVFAAVAGLLLGARWLDLRHGSRTTGGGAPAAPGTFRRYALILLPVALALWLGAHGVARWGV